MNVSDSVAACRALAARDRAVFTSIIPELPQSAPTRAQPLAGLAFAVKDNIDVAGLATTAGCPSFAYHPAQDATVVANLRAAGALPVAKTNLDQFATGLVGTRSPYGMPTNPRAPQRIPGGSSSGSAVAVAAGAVPFALGTDTAGSGRIPAAFTGIIGFKPTRGWLSTRGVVPAVASLDCVSVFAGSIARAWQVVNAAAGGETDQRYARPRPAVVIPTGRVRIGVPAERWLKNCQSEWRAGFDRALQALGAAGHVIVEIDFTPFAEAARLLYGGAWVAERTAAVGDHLNHEPTDADPIVAKIIRAGRSMSAVQMCRDRDRLQILAMAAAVQWQGMDALLLPTAECHPTVAEIAADPIALNSRLGRFTNFANLLDTCAVAVPAPTEVISGDPIGVTLFAPAWHDLLIARLGATVVGENPADVAGSDGSVTIAVFGAHLRGQPLHGQLLAWGGRFVCPCLTAPRYRMFRLPASPGIPPRPGLVAVSEPSLFVAPEPGLFAVSEPGNGASSGGAAISGECYRITPTGLGLLLASIAAPLGLGRVTLADGSTVIGFLCEAHATADSEDITASGSWRRALGVNDIEDVPRPG